MSLALRREGVEEKKEDGLERTAGGEYGNNTVSPRLSKSQENDEEERKHGFQAQVENFAKTVFGSCGTALGVASLFGEGDCSNCQTPFWPTPHGPECHRVGRADEEEVLPALSIADELRRLAALEGRAFPDPGPRAADIPRFLGEEAVRSFEDDNISAISAHTLEELAENGIVHPVSQRLLRQHQYHQQQQQKRQQQTLHRHPEQQQQQRHTEQSIPTKTPTLTQTISSSSSERQMALRATQAEI